MDNFIISCGLSVTKNQLQRSTFNDLLETLKTDPELAELINQAEQLKIRRSDRNSKLLTSLILI